MEAYSSFAEVYDLFMDNVPYEEWSVYLQQLLKENGVEDGLVLDLGCGTGTLTELLAAQGYDMIGVDASEEMHLRFHQLYPGIRGSCPCVYPCKQLSGSRRRVYL